MSIWNKVLVGLIAVASVAFFYMAARTLKTHQHWCELAAKFEKKIAQVQEDNRRLAEGSPNSPGIRQLRTELTKLLMDRRRAWFGCEAKVTLNPQKATAEVLVKTSQPDPHGIAANTIVYGFEKTAKEAPGRYLGEFKVTKSTPKSKQVVLAPTSQLSPRELNNLAGAKGSWTLYEVMPRDGHDVFATLTDEEKKALLPAASLPEFLKDGKESAKDKSAAQASGGKYLRMLRDYQVLLGAARLQRTLLLDKIAAVKYDNQLVTDALAKAQSQEKASRAELASAQKELQESVRQRDAVASYLKRLEGELTTVQTAVDELIKSNQAKAGQMAKLQLEAARRIDERTRAMARSGAGG
ncbi:MAG: hypothetical protein LLF97_09210 [Planctomycetaceae bacterium]|nr:hypothetical protein [Planctomycetaceae bacterium]